MKKIIKFLLVSLCLMPININYISATENIENTDIIESTTVEDLGGGYYLVTTIEQDNTAINRASKTTSGSKKVSYKNGNTVLWTVQVNGTFTYTGSSAKCTSATVGTSCPNKDWKIASQSASKSGNKAIAKATGKKYFMGVCIQTIDRTVTLTCSNNGKLS